MSSIQPQRAKIRGGDVQTYAPVGARREKHQASLGHTLMVLEQDPDSRGERSAAA
jgi:hypothetical protein